MEKAQLKLKLQAYGDVGPSVLLCAALNCANELSLTSHSLGADLGDQKGESRAVLVHQEGPQSQP
jgi:hypothetical protein